MDDFIKAIGNNEKQHEIVVAFKDGSSGIYTMNIFDLLKSDPDVLEIMDNETGELLYYR